jgi:hypothetical protein
MTIGKHSEGRSGRTLDELLDEALVQTFPASDPVAVGRPTGTEPPHRPPDRRSPETRLPRRPTRRSRARRVG